ncbi:MAG: nicotinate-nucleotide adenylyltransferase, partial [Dorea sp.]
MKIGIMGGTFDPIHNGHLMLGETAYRQFELDEVWFMPNGNPPHKSRFKIGSDANDRLCMVELAIDGKEYFCLEDYEVKKKEVSCSYATLEYMKQKYPEDEFYFIIGADSLFSIEHWVKPERIFPICTILATFRDDIDTSEEMNQQIQYLRKKYDAKIELLISPLMKISSSQIREDL